MNPVLLLTHNCLELTKKCVESVIAQDVETSIYTVDNGSTDGTESWFCATGILGRHYNYNVGVSRGWNEGLSELFFNSDHVLVLNNDTIIPPWFYRTLLSCDLPFVTGVSFENMDEVMKPSDVSLSDGPDFSAFLIRRDCWEKVGPFDERFVHYCNDMDYHIRAHRAGVTLLNSNIKFYHERSSTLKNADPEDRERISMQADRDRATFREIYGVGANDPAYADLFKA